VQGWIALHEGRYDEALTLLDLPLARGYDLSYYRDLRALCDAALGNPDAARAEYAATIAGVGDRSIAVTGDTVRCAVAVAHAAVGDVEGAERWVEEAAPGGVPASDDMSLPAVRAFLALARDDLDRGEELLREAVALTRNERDLDDLLGNVPLRLAAAPGDEAGRRRRTAVVERVAAEDAQTRRALLAARGTPTADSELAESMSGRPDGPGDVSDVGVRAIAARRLADRGDADGAADGYERLLGSQFEPEATMALARTLRTTAEAAAARGDAAETRRAQARLVELGEADDVDAALAIAAALRVAGDPRAAQAELRGVLEAAQRAGKGDLVQQGLGDLGLTMGDPGGAAEHFQAAIALPQVQSDPARVGQLETRTAVADLLAGRFAGASRHVARALDAWRKAGAFEPAWTIVQEARSALADGGASAALERAVEALATIVDAQRTEERPDDERPDKEGPDKER
jgi:tetratricopeptide (TPR) repeat protein